MLFSFVTNDLSSIDGNWLHGSRGNSGGGVCGFAGRGGSGILHHAALGLEVEPVGGVDGRARRHADGRGIDVQLEVEAAHEHRKGAHRLKQRKLVADALAPPSAKRQVLEVLRWWQNTRPSSGLSNEHSRRHHT